jgi:hypothetical protein
MTDNQKSRPTAAQAATWVVVAIAFALFQWWEFGWRLRRGDYAGIGLKHTWYWYASPLFALAVFGIALLFMRRAGRRP